MKLEDVLNWLNHEATTWEIEDLKNEAERRLDAIAEFGNENDYLFQARQRASPP